MGFMHSMHALTEGIRATAPARWRSLDGFVGVFWEAEGRADARGYYLSPDPRLMIFLNDVAPNIRITNREGGEAQAWRPMSRAVYVPAGVPLWTSFTSEHRFSHLDVHLHRDRLLRFLTPSVGQSQALAAINRPVEIQDAGNVAVLASLLAGELALPSRHAVHAESLVGSLVTGLLDIPAEEEPPAAGGLTPAQMNRLAARLRESGGLRLTVADMAATAGLSESWFTAAFKKTTGKTPYQWQLDERIATARRLLVERDLSLAEIAAQLGFSDQAHLTRAFRQVAGQTPAAWRRAQLLA